MELSRSRVLNGAARSATGSLAGGRVGAVAFAIRIASSGEDVVRSSVFRGAFICVTSSLRYIVQFIDPPKFPQLRHQTGDFPAGSAVVRHTAGEGHFAVGHEVP